MSDTVLWGNSSEWTSGTVLLVELTFYGGGMGAQTTKNRVILFIKYWENLQRFSKKARDQNVMCRWRGFWCERWVRRGLAEQAILEENESK